MKEIPLTRGLVALVDDEDFEQVSQFKWYPHVLPHTTYATRFVKDETGRVKTSQSMHRFLMDASKGVEVDHKNGNGLDNQRGNLRFASKSQNVRNRRCNRKGNKSGFKGVYVEPYNRFRAVIKWEGKNVCIGLFGNAEEAAAAYDQRANDLYGEFAKTNRMMSLLEEQSHA